ncbi:hypothetical protein ACIROD_15890 [Peribacillus sp. NPDC101481]|uniref:hypothetical protein n=1 Tax=Peribacillus sp. NPDC101481 TaxID=3364403 RepID=UPI00380C185F
MVTIENRDLTKLADNHWEHVKYHFKNNTNIIRYNDIENFCRNIQIDFTFEKLIKADYKTLKYIKEYLYTKVKKISQYKDCSNKILSVYNNNFSQSNKSMGENKYNAIELVESLEIKVCPYCNRNYIDTRAYKNVKKSGCQIDHFFDKYNYPLFALSFYNLIPVCPSCNHTKSTDEFYISPYDETKTTNELITFDWDLKDADYLQKCSNIEISYSCSTEMAEQFNKLKLEKPYKMHNDIVYEIVKKVELYDSDKVKELINDFPGITFNDDEKTKILFGTFLDNADFLNRPLSKLTYDILKKEKVIE